MQWANYWDVVKTWSLTSGIRLGGILLLAVIALFAVKVVSGRFFTHFERINNDAERGKRAETLKTIVRSALSIGVVLIAGLMILGELNIEIGPILAAAGVLGLAIGFGAQKLVEDVISGFFILFEDQIRVGDVVQIGDKGGLVEKVNLRMVILRDLAGNVHYIRNGSIGTVTNMTKEYSRYVFDIGVAYREDVDEVIDIIKSVDEEMRRDEVFKNDILEPIEILGLDKFADSAVVIKARTKTLPIRQWAVGREFNRRLKKRFDELGVEIPFPHTTLYIGKDKDGTSPPLDLRVEKKSDVFSGDE